MLYGELNGFLAPPNVAEQYSCYLGDSVYAKADYEGKHMKFSFHLPCPPLLC